MKPTYIFVCASLLASVATTAFAADMTCGGKVTQAALTKQTNFVPNAASTDEELLDYLKVALNLCLNDASSYWAQAAKSCMAGFSPMGATQTAACYDPAVALHNLKP